MTGLSRRAAFTGAAAVSAATAGPGLAQDSSRQGAARVPRAIALEEHFWTPELRDGRSGHDVPYGAHIRRRLDDIGEGRIREMDEAGVDLQVLSLQEPGVQDLEGAEAVRLAREANDALDRAVRAHPGRFAGFAALPTAEPAAAVREFERAVRDLGFRGVLVNCLTRGRFLNEARFWPILEAAEALGAPIYLHPATPHPEAIRIYYGGFRPDAEDPRTSIVARGGHGFAAEVQLSAVRLVMGDVFDRFPRLQFVLGHMGEGLPFVLPRVERSIRGATFGTQGDAFRIGERSLAGRLRSNFHFATSGRFTHACQSASNRGSVAGCVLGRRFWRTPSRGERQRCPVPTHALCCRPAWPSTRSRPTPTRSPSLPTRRRASGAARRAADAPAGCTACTAAGCSTCPRTGTPSCSSSACAASAAWPWTAPGRRSPSRCRPRPSLARGAAPSGSTASSGISASPSAAGPVPPWRGG